MAISNTSLTTAIANVYVSSGNSVVSVMYFCNTNSTAKNISVYAVPSGTTTVDANVQIYKDVQIAAGDTFVVDMEKLVLANGDMIQANTSANLSVTATVSYVGI
jgi:ribosome-binding ATPase YchF (GTP1/OBG family)